MKEKPTQKLMRTIYVSNLEKMDVFRIHVFEHSLKFDSYFAYGISKNDEVYNMVCEIENLWKKRAITMHDVFVQMVAVLTKHETYLRDFYFRPEELDFTGRLTNSMSYTPTDDKNYTYFMFLKNKNNIKQIDRKEFEDNMKNNSIKYSYIEHYHKKEAIFYNYRLTGLKDSGKNCYLMIVGEDLKMAYVEN